MSTAESHEGKRRIDRRIDCPYSDDDGRIVWQRFMKDKDDKPKPVFVKLVNFKARIISDITATMAWRRCATTR